MLVVVAIFAVIGRRGGWVAVTEIEVGEGG